MNFAALTNQSTRREYTGYASRWNNSRHGGGGGGDDDEVDGDDDYEDEEDEDDEDDPIAERARYFDSLDPHLHRQRRHHQR